MFWQLCMSMWYESCGDLEYVHYTRVFQHAPFPVFLSEALYFLISFIQTSFACSWTSYKCNSIVYILFCPYCCMLSIGCSFLLLSEYITTCLSICLLIHTQLVSGLLLLFSCPVMSNSLQLHGLLHTRPLCPSPSPRVCPSSCSLHWWCCPTISYSDILFSFCPWSFPAPGTFPMSQQFTSDNQNTGAFSFSISPMGLQDWFPLRFTDLISLLSKGLSGVFSSTTVWRHQFFGTLPSLQSSSHNLSW